MTTTSLLRLAALASLAALPANAQDGAPAPAGSTLAARMQAFVQEIRETPNTGLAAYFPRRGDWTRVQKIGVWRGERRVGERTGVWRFAGAETARVIGADGPACSSFDTRVVDVGPFEGLFGMQTLFNPQPWRLVRGSRFVPRGASADSPVFVEWRREDGAWVVSAFGEEGDPESGPRVLGRPAGPFSRDTSLVPEDAAFAQADAYVLVLDGRRYIKYGNPRPLSRTEVERVAVLGRVSIYVERGKGPHLQEYVYIPVAPGQYQPYETVVGLPCQ
jgi:hypothetical protein